MEHLRPRRYVPSGPRKAPRRSGRTWGRAATVIGALALFSFILPGGIGGAAPGQPAPTLKDLVARAKVLSNEINSLNEQYNGLRIQLEQARTESRVAAQTYVLDDSRLGAGKRPARRSAPRPWTRYAPVRAGSAARCTARSGC